MGTEGPSPKHDDRTASDPVEVDGAFSWIGQEAERQSMPVIELSVADLEPDEADLALQDLIDDPDGVRLASADLTAYAARFVAELLGEDDEQEQDLSDDPTVKIALRPSRPELDPREWSDGFCALGDVVGIHEQLGQRATRSSEPPGATGESGDPLWFAATLPTRPPPRPRPLARRRQLAVLGASSVMTALVIALLLGLPLDGGTVAEPARVGLARILESGPPGSLEAHATTGPIGDSSLPESPTVELVSPTDSTLYGPESSTLESAPSCQQSVSSPDPFALDSCVETPECAPAERAVAAEPSAAPDATAVTAAPVTVERTAALSAESMTAADLERLALRHLDAGELDAAIATAELWTTVDPANATGYLCLGAALLDRGRIADARAVFRRCVDDAKGAAVGECLAFVGRR